MSEYINDEKQSLEANKKSPNPSILRTLREEVYESYLIYSISTLNRSLPSLEDGMKIVQRRILYTMWSYGNRRTDKLAKCVGIVGKTMTYFHPHGDASIYAALVRLARDFILLHPLIEGQGNFGSIDGDEAAAMRYTEARLASISHLLLEEIHEETVDFQANYDGSVVEPKHLVPQFPIILINGSQGIAVGYSSNIPTHNLNEVIDAVIMLIDKPEATLIEIMNFIQGPDFVSAGIVSSKGDIYKAYEKGEGMITIRGVTKFEGEDKIIITEIPYQVQKSTIVAQIINEVRKGNIEGITSVRDESSSKIRIVVELKKKAQREVIINQLYNLTPLSSSFKINLLALDMNGVPRTFTLKEILEEFILFRHSTIVKKTSFKLKESHKKIHTLFGFVVALDNIDELLKEVRNSEDVDTLREVLMGKKWNSTSLYNYMLKNNPNPPTQFSFTESQVEDIFNLKLTRFTKMEVNKVTEQIQKEIENILWFRKIIDSRARREEIIKDELSNIKKKFSISRKTIVETNPYDFEDEDFIPKEEVVITLSKEGFLKRVPLHMYREQRRGGKGSSGFSNSNSMEDFVMQVSVVNSHDKLLIFTSRGKVYSIKAYQIPEGGKNTKGRFILNCMELEENDTVIKILPFKKDNNAHIIFATNHGSIRKNSIEEFTDLRRNGKIYMKLEEANLKIIDVVYCVDEDEIMLFTKRGKAIRFDCSQLRTFSSRNSVGVRGCILGGDDEVVAMTCLHPNDSNKFILTITSNGLGKSTTPEVYRKTNRGTKGVNNVKLTKKNYVVAVMVVSKTQEEEEGNNILVVTHNGQIVNCSVDNIRVAGRSTQGVTIVKLNTNDYIVSASKI
jgi:DNA gyrase subunit A